MEPHTIMTGYHALDVALGQIGLQAADLRLAATCIASGGIGSLAYFLVLVTKFSAVGQNDIIEPERNLPASELGKLFSRFIKISSAFVAHTMLGMIIGLMVTFAFIGSIEPDRDGLARLAFICVLLGYQAPRIWSMQEMIVNKAVEQRLTGIIEGFSDALREKGAQALAVAPTPTPEPVDQPIAPDEKKSPV